MEALNVTIPQESSIPPALFGALEELNILTGSVSIVLIILAVLTFEYFFELLHQSTHDTPFQDMVSSIEKELMIVGCMAFIFKIIVNTTNFMNEEWLVSLEFADLVVPITSFFFCGEGLILILMSVRQCDVWSKAYHLKLIELFDEYYILSATSLSSIAGNKIISEMEFRIMHTIFCDQYKIQRVAFQFDEYVNRCFEKYLLSIVTIRPADWIFVCVLVGLNWVRNLLKLNIDTCEIDDVHCRTLSSTKLFTFGGCLVLAITCLLAYISRMYELRLMATRGVCHKDDYITFLANAEKTVVAGAEKKRLDENGLKAAVSEAKFKAAMLAEQEESMFSFLWRCIVSVYDLMKGIALPESPKFRAQEMLDDVDRHRQAGKTGKQSPAPVKAGNLAHSTTVATGWFQFSIHHSRSSMSSSGSGKQPTNAVAPVPIPASPIKFEFPSFMNSQNKRVQPDSADPVSTSPTTSYDVVQAFHSDSIPNSTPVGSGHNIGPLEASPPGTSWDVENNNNNNNNNKNSTPMPLSGRVDSSGVMPFSGRIHDPIQHHTTSNNEHGGDEPVDIEFTSPGLRLGASDATALSGEGEGASIRLDASHLRDHDEDELHDVVPEVRINIPPPISIGGQGRGLSRGNTFKVSKQEMDEVVNSPPESKPKQKNMQRSMENFAPPPTTPGGKLKTGLSLKMRVRNNQASLQSGSSDDISKIFMFGKPKLYFEFVETLIMIIALYMALWLTSFSTSAYHELRSRAWQLITLAPGFLSLIVYVYVVKCSALLKAIAVIDHDTIEEVLEHMEGSRLLGTIVRDKILQRLTEMGEPEAELFGLFKEIDDNGSNLLSRREFQMFLEALGITFSRKRWNHIFREIDRNFDNEISFDELFLFLFPTHDKAKSDEKKRLKVIRYRVKTNAAKYARAMEQKANGFSLVRFLTGGMVHYNLPNASHFEDHQSIYANSLLMRSVHRYSSGDQGGDQQVQETPQQRKIAAALAAANRAVALQADEDCESSTRRIKAKPDLNDEMGNV